MLDTHTIARQQAGAGLTGNQMDAVRQAAERGAAAIDVSALASKTDLSGLEARIHRAMLRQTAVAGAARPRAGGAALARLSGTLFG